MKRWFLFSTLACSAGALSAQTTCPNVFDYKDNNTIDIEDFLGILGVFADDDTGDDGIWDSRGACFEFPPF